MNVSTKEPYVSEKKYWRPRKKAEPKVPEFEDKSFPTRAEVQNIIRGKCPDRQSPIFDCDCGWKYIKTRDLQTCCLKCIANKAREMAKS